jgi:RNA polymerase sigma factor (sigma-70 family)
MSQPIHSESEPHALIRRALAGDEDAATLLIRRLMPVIRARVRRWLGRDGERLAPHDGEDLVQEIWLRLIDDGGRRLLAYDPNRGATLEGYAGMIAEREISKLSQKVRAKKRGGVLVPVQPEHAEVPGDLPTPEDEAAANDLAARLGNHLDSQLSARGQLVLRYAFVDDLPAARVAQILGVTVQVVYNWQHKIRSAARAFLTSA